MRYEAPAAALARWNPAIRAANDTAANVINIYEEIGENWDGTGFTVKTMAAALEKAAGGDITVNINSAGGSFFDGLAIYNLLNEYAGTVKVKVVGMAASAASVIAMAGDTIEIGEQAFIMIHNAWVMAMGNKEELRVTADMLAKFDDSMAGIYAKVTGLDDKEVHKMMAATTWLDGKAALDNGFATALLGGADVVEQDNEPTYNAALRKIDLTLARTGMPRSERRRLIKEISSTPSAAVDTNITPSADAFAMALQGLHNKITRSDENE